MFKIKSKDCLREQIFVLGQCSLLKLRGKSTEVRGENSLVSRQQRIPPSPPALPAYPLLQRHLCSLCPTYYTYLGTQLLLNLEPM